MSIDTSKSISSISYNGTDIPLVGAEPTLQEKTVTPSTSAQTIIPDTGYDGLSKVTVNAMTTATQATPSISVNSSGLITASATQSAGYVSSGTKSATKQLTTKAAATITPGTADQTIASGAYLTGVQTIKGDSNLVASNIKSGTSIFGVAGSYSGGTPNLQSKSVTYTSNGTATVTPDAGYDGLSSIDVEVNVSGGGSSGASAKWDDVTFIDYDGSVLYSYSLAEVQSLTELPELPAHDGLVCQGWSWTLEAIKALNRPVTVGAMYITDDGTTRLHIRIATVGRMTVPLYIGQTVSNGVSIDWGDGSTTQTLSGTGNVNTSHTYAEPGDYVISLMPQGGCKLSFGNRSSSYCVMGSTGNNGRVYCNMLQEVYVGKNVTSIGNNTFSYCYSLASITIPDGVTSIGNYAFSYCYSLASITIPAGVTSISDNTFNSCYSLASITIPDGVTSIGNNTFISCFSLARITIPDGVTSIGNYAFNACYVLVSITIPAGVTSIGNNTFGYCHSLARITIPAGVTSISNYAFQSCYGMRYYDFSECTAIPALSNTNAFNKIPSDCQMLIPSALYNNWKTATNWATYASKMVSV